jgi:hypothetical protein
MLLQGEMPAIKQTKGIFHLLFSEMKLTDLVLFELYTMNYKRESLSLLLWFSVSQIRPSERLFVFPSHHVVYISENPKEL